MNVVHNMPIYSVLRQPSIHKCPFVCQHMKCQHSDEEVPFGLITLHDQDLPMHLWAEAARTTVYLQNHTPRIVLENKTHEEVFFGKKPKFSYHRIFGCPMYIHIPKEKRTKLDPSGKKGIFVGIL